LRLMKVVSVVVVVVMVSPVEALGLVESDVVVTMGIESSDSGVGVGASSD
jgi:hypothetical protein